MSEAEREASLISRRGALGLLGAIGGALMLGGCGLLGREASYRYRVTIEASTPHGLVHGSSVLEEVAGLENIRIGDMSGKSAGTQGEAIVIDLPDGPVFALLARPDARGRLGSAVTIALAPRAAGGERADYINAVTRLGGWFGSAKAELPREDWPLMVRFRDLADPTTVERVEPEAVDIRRILLETTRDEVTTGIERRLGWLPSQRGSLIRRLSVPDPSKPPLGARLTVMHFRTVLNRDK